MEGGVRYRLPLHQRYINSTLNLLPGMTTFGKLSADPRTASLGGQPLMNLTLQLTF